jgi:CHAT domain-containing protein/cytochrome c-type biogenesis protein CcmH/NrfG
LEPQERGQQDRGRISPRLDVPAVREPSCPQLEEWGLYEAGLLPQSRALELVEHASTCDGCGALLAGLRVGEDPGHDTALLFKSGTSAWKRGMLKQIVRRQREDNQASVRFRLRPIWAAAAAAAVVMAAGVGWWTYRANSPDEAFRLLAQAYAEQRPFELRFPGASYSPIRVQRGSALAPPVELTDARSLIARKLRSRPESAPWLRALARADLLQWQYASAIENLRKAQEFEPENPEITGDLGIAYLQRAEIESRPQDVAQAVEFLTKAVENRSSDATLRFNRALAFDRLAAPKSAIDDWNEFLRLEPSGGWADEARQHLANDRELVRKQAEREHKSHRSEDLILALVAQEFRATPSLDPHAVAEDLLAQHQDRWLRDLLNSSDAPGNRRALEALARAVQEAAAGNAAAAEAFAGDAVTRFRLARNEAGVVFALYEQAYGFERMSQPTGCLDRAEAAKPKAGELGYRWVEIRLELTIASCEAGLRGRHEAGYRLLVGAQESAKKFRFQTLELESLGFRASILRLVGSYRESIQMDSNGLHRFWAGEGATLRGYQFSYGIATAASALGYSRTAIAMMREAVELAALQPDRTLEAMARSRYGEILSQGGQLPEAENQFDLSARAFETQPSSPSLLLYRSYAELSRAQIEAQQNQVEIGLARIGRMEEILPRIDNPTVEARTWSAKSDLMTRAGRLPESEESLRKILYLRPTTEAYAPRIGDPSALSREIAQAVLILTDRELQSGDAAGALHLWMEYNPCFQVAGPDRTAVQVIYASLPSGPVVWVRSDNATHYARLTASASNLAFLSSNFRRQVSNPAAPLTAIRSRGRQLYSGLIGPIENWIKDARSLYIAAEGPFGGVPFSALVGADGRWLADRYRIVYSPPFEGRPPAKGDRLSPRDRLVAAGYGDAAQILEAPLPSLPSVATDLETSGLAFPNHTLLAGQGATRAALQRAFPQAGIFHFSGHAIVTASDAALVLASDPAETGEDRTLWASQIPAIAFKNCRLVVLAACSTGRIGEEDADPSSVMVRAFLLAGVPDVIAARWDVDSNATSIVMTLFYTALANGMSAEEALTSAVTELRQKLPFAHPYYWAAFDLFRS